MNRLRSDCSDPNSRMIKFLALRNFSFALLLYAALATVCVAGSVSSVERISEREIKRRQAAMPQGADAVVRGEIAMKEKNYAQAHEEFRVAVAYLPDAVVSGSNHDRAIAGFCDSGVALAEQRIAEGKYGEAEAICAEILTERYNPNCDE